MTLGPTLYNSHPFPSSHPVPVYKRFGHMYLYKHSQHIIHTLFQHTSNFLNSQIILGRGWLSFGQKTSPCFYLTSHIKSRHDVKSFPSEKTIPQRRQLPREAKNAPPPLGPWFGVVGFFFRHLRSIKNYNTSSTLPQVFCAKKHWLWGLPLMAPLNLMSNLAPIAGSRYIYIHIYVYIHMFPSGLPTFLVWKNPPTF